MELQDRVKSHSAASDLRWYFARAEAGPLRSNFGAMVHRLAMGRARSQGSPGAVDDEALEAAARSGSVARVLRALEPATADVLWRAFGGEWPEELASLGELSGIVPVTPRAIEAHRTSRTKLGFGEWMRHLAARKTPRAVEVLQGIQDQARSMRSRALSSYLTNRRVNW